MVRLTLTDADQLPNDDGNRDDPKPVVRETIVALIRAGGTPNTLNVPDQATRAICRRGNGYISRGEAFGQVKEAVAAMLAAGELHAPPCGAWRLIATE